MRTTGRFDVNKQEIFEGDKVLCAWGWFTWQGAQKTRYRIHTITVLPAHMMNNGKMHDDGAEIIFCLGTAYNFWKGKSVRKLSAEDIAKIGMREEVDFFYDDNGKAVKFTDQHFMGLSDEDWQKELEKRRKEINKLFC